MNRKNTKRHQYWHKKVDGQILNCINAHPQWFNVANPNTRKTLINSLAKRIVGEIVAEENMNKMHIEKLESCYAEGCDTGIKVGDKTRWVRAVTLPFYPGLMERMKIAWFVLKGGEVILRPKPGELEDIIGKL